MARPADLSPKRVWLEDDECQRMNRAEFEATRCLLGALSYVAHANDDLQKRMELIPHDRQRMSMALGGLRALAALTNPGRVQPGALVLITQDEAMTIAKWLIELTGGDNAHERTARKKEE